MTRLLRLEQLTSLVELLELLIFFSHGIPVHLSDLSLHLCCDNSWSNSQRSDGWLLGRDSQGEVVHGCLRRSVGAPGLIAVASGTTGGHDDISFRLTEVRDGGFDEGDAGEEVDVEVIPPFCCVRIGELCDRVKHAVVQNQTIKATELVQTLANGAVSDLCELVSICPFSTTLYSLPQLLLPASLYSHLILNRLIRLPSLVALTLKSAKSAVIYSTCPGYWFFSSSSGPAERAIAKTLSIGLRLRRKCAMARPMPREQPVNRVTRVWLDMVVVGEDVRLWCAERSEGIESLVYVVRSLII